MELGEKIKLARQKKRITQKDLATSANITRVALGNYERGERIPTVDIFLRIAKALEVSTDELLDYHVNKGEPTEKEKAIELLKQNDFVVKERFNFSLRGTQFTISNKRISLESITLSDDILIKLVNQTLQDKSYKKATKDMFCDKFNNLLNSYMYKFICSVLSTNLDEIRNFMNSNEAKDLTVKEREIIREVYREEMNSLSKNIEELKKRYFIEDNKKCSIMLSGIIDDTVKEILQKSPSTDVEEPTKE